MFSSKFRWQTGVSTCSGWLFSWRSVKNKRQQGHLLCVCLIVEEAMREQKDVFGEVTFGTRGEKANMRAGRDGVYQGPELKGGDNSNHLSRHEFGKQYFPREVHA